MINLIMALTGNYSQFCDLVDPIAEVIIIDPLIIAIFMLLYDLFIERFVVWVIVKVIISIRKMLYFNKRRTIKKLSKSYKKTLDIQKRKRYNIIKKSRGGRKCTRNFMKLFTN